MRKLKTGDVLMMQPLAAVVSDVQVDKVARQITAKATITRVEVDETWRVDRVFSDGSIAVTSQVPGDPAGGHGFVVHDARGLVHADGAAIDHPAGVCETWGCERTASGLCGRFA